MKKTFLPIMAFLILAGTGCGESQSEAWTGFYYPDGEMSEEIDWIIESGFYSYDECYEWAYEKALEQNFSGEALFECGVSCEWNTDYFVHVCDETLDESLPTAQQNGGFDTSGTSNTNQLSGNDCEIVTLPESGGCLHPGELSPVVDLIPGSRNCTWSDTDPECVEIINTFCAAEIALADVIEASMPQDLDELERYQYFNENGGIDYSGAWYSPQHEFEFCD